MRVSTVILFMKCQIDMNKKEQLMSMLQGMGYTPEYDEDGDIRMVYQMKHVCFLLQEDDEENYLSVMLPQFADVEEGEVSLSLAVCNKMTRELKLAKVYVDHTFKAVTGVCEFFYANEESLEYSIRMSLRTIGVLRSLYLRTKKELTA